jgi:hypothetical protein
VQRNKLIIYSLSGFMSGLAAWVFVSRVSTTRSDFGSGFELTAITHVLQAREHMRELQSAEYPDWRLTASPFVPHLPRLANSPQLGSDRTTP